jgi:hypothetical protein
LVVVAENTDLAMLSIRIRTRGFADADADGSRWPIR